VARYALPLCNPCLRVHARFPQRDPQDRLILIHCGKCSPESQAKTVGLLETFPLGELASRANESARCVKIKVSPKLKVSLKIQVLRSSTISVEQSGESRSRIPHACRARSGSRRSERAHGFAQTDEAAGHIPHGARKDAILPRKWTAKMFHVKHFRHLFVLRPRRSMPSMPTIPCLATCASLFMVGARPRPRPCGLAYSSMKPRG
jgi:hypothetical protein